MRENPRPSELYRHFKGNMYQIMGIARDSENEEAMVVYQALYGDYAWYVRPLSMFMSEVDVVKYPNCTQRYRFEKVECGSLETAVENKEENVNQVEQMRKADADMNVDAAVKEDAATKADAVAEEDATVKEDVTMKTTAAQEIVESAKEETADKKADEQEEVMEIAAIGKPLPTEEKTPEEGGLDPLVLDFLDADSYEEKLNILAALHHRITNEMITTMAIASDIEIGEMELEDRYQELRYCLTTKDRFEIKRY